MIVVPRTVNSRALIEAARTSGMDLLCLMPYGVSSSSEDGRRQIELTYAFADDPRLAVMLLAFNGNILIRASFLVKCASDIRTDSLQDFMLQLPDRVDRNGMTIAHIAH